MTPIPLRKKNLPTSEQIVDELDKLVDEFKTTLTRLRENYSTKENSKDRQENPYG